jgi:hypothetical protein
MLVAVIALVAALAGTATALPGKNKVDKNDIKKNAVKSKAIAKGAVKSPDIGDGQVAAADLAPNEVRHVVGAPGEPAFSNGGEGDCVWTSAAAQISNYVPTSFYKDATGHVHLSGIMIASDGPGGDATCDASDPGEDEDGHLFTLPAGYRPGNTIAGGLGTGLAVIAPDQGAILSGTTPRALPPGVVTAGSFGPAPTIGLDGVIYRTDPAPASASASASDRPDRISGSVLRRLTR